MTQPTNAITIAMPSVPTMSEVESLKEICKVAAYSGFLSSTAPRNDMAWRSADAFFVVMYGREIGIPAMTALKTIYVIDGKPSCSGQALLSLMRRAGVEVEIPDPSTIVDSATIRIRRPGGEWRTYTYTQQMAKDAGLWGSRTWAKYWREMLIWRAVSTGNKYECSDITGGLYTIEELAPNTTLDADGAPVGDVIVSNAPRLNSTHQPTESIVAVSQPSASVSGAGLPTPPYFPPTDEERESPLEYLERKAQENVTQEPDPLDWTDGLGANVTPIQDDQPPNLYLCEKLRVNVSRTSTMFLLMTANGTNIVAPAAALVGLQVNGMFVEALAQGVYPLNPAWTVQAELEGNTWRVDAIDAGVAEGVLN